MERKTIQNFLGYLIGGTVFVLVIPYVLYQASRSLDHSIGIQLIPDSGLRLTLAVILAVYGMIFGLWSLITQNRIGKGGPLEAFNVEISPKTKHLVVSGPYRYTRNPMLFGTCLFYYALAIFLNSITVLVIAAVFMTLMLIVVKRTEEKRLYKDFGSEYEEYRKRCSFFIPWLPKDR